MAAPPWAASRSRRVEMRLRGLLAGPRARRHVAGGGRARARPASSRPTCRATTTGRPRSSTPTAACCAPSPRPTASGGSGPRSTTSIRSISPCSRPTRIAASTTIGASIRWRRCAPPSSGSAAAASCRAPRRSPCRPPGCWSPISSASDRAHSGDQDPPVGARPAARMALLQARGAGHLPDAGADGRQPRGRARRLASPTSARNPSTSTPPKRRSSSPSRNRPSAAGPTARPPPPRPRASACWRAACSTR